MTKKPNCDMIELYAFLGKKWTVPLYHNLDNTPQSFNDLNTLSKNMISPILLSTRLKEFKKFKIIKKIKKGKKTGYVLTTEGNRLKGILHDIKAWGIKTKLHIPEKCKTQCICDDIFDKKK